MATAEFTTTPYIHSVTKRLLDIIVSVIGLLILVIFFPIIAVAIKLTSSGPIFYRRQRLGKNGESFKLVKFRTMFVDSDTKIRKLRASKNDPRITLIGGILRRLYLDELPQFWHVLRGAMSAVGPRPELPELIPELLKFEPRFNERHALKPGLTGLAQVDYQKAFTAKEAAARFNYDLQYARTASLWLDLFIILKTIRAVFYNPEKFAMLKFIFEIIPNSIKARMILSVFLNFVTGLVPVASLGFLGVALVELNIQDDAAIGNSMLFDLLRNALDTVGIELSFASALTISGLLVLLRVAISYFRLITINHPLIKFQEQRIKTIATELYRADWKFLSNQKQSRLFTIIRTEARQITSGFSVFTSVIASFIEIIVYVIGAALLSWQIALVLLTAQIVSVLVNNIFILRSKALARLALPVRIKYNARALDAFGDIKAVKANHMENTVLGRLFPVMDEQRRLSVKSSYVTTFRSSFNITWRFAMLASSVVIAGLFLGLETELILVLILVAPALISRINSLLNSYSRWANLTISFDATHTILFGARDAIEQRSSKAIGALKKGIKLENISFGYTPHKEEDELGQVIMNEEEEEEELIPAIKEVSLDIPYGSIVALVGHSGSGKTTLLDLITGLFRPQSGRILIDGNDYNTVDIHSWRDQIAYVAQRTELFNDTVRNNLMLLKPGASQKELDEACRKAQIYDFIQELPQQYETIVGDKGSKFSGGQSQRIAVARGLLKDYSVLILDESTSNLDVETEEKLMQEIYATRGKCTVIMSAHRITAAMRADIVFFLQDGKLIEAGAPHELVNKKGSFYSYWQKFYGDEQTRAKITV